MIDHVSLQVRDLAVSAAFYRHVLEPLGYTCLIERPASIGFGLKYPELWLNVRPDLPPADPATGAHVCLRARSIEAVDAFHQRALASGGHDDGAPGKRQASLVAYYGAFIRDPDGNRIEVLCVPGG